MSKIRVLLVDDAVVVRRMVSDVVNADPDMEVIGTAASGKIALARLREDVPDLVVMDVEMPDLDGLQTLREIRKTHSTLPVIMFSTLTERGAAATLDALSFGANDYVHKPANVGSVAAAQARIRDELVPKIKVHARFRGGRPIAPTERAAELQNAGLLAKAKPKPVTLKPAPPKPSRGQPVDIVVIGISTGGPAALDVLLRDLPGTFPVPILIVQHMPPMFTRLLAQRLNTRCPLAVRELAHGEPIVAGEIGIAPGDFHVTLARHGLSLHVELNQDAPENSCRPAVDPLFRSAAALFGARTLGVVMTGMGKDGLAGAQAIKAAGGQMLAQDEASSVVWGMPGFVSTHGLADAELPLPELAREIGRRVVASRPTSLSSLYFGVRPAANEQPSA